MSDRTKKLAFNFTHVLFNCLFGNLFVSSQDLEVICGHLVDLRSKGGLALRRDNSLGG